LYGFLTLAWVTTIDLRRLLSGRVFNYKLPRTSAASWGLLFLSKTFYYGYMVVIPLVFHPFLYVAAAFVGIHLIQGLTLSLVFQLAHALGENSFPKPGGNSVEKEWAVHEVETTANFAPASGLATWYLGGLNFQIEHHLFPKVSHVHYPAISRIVKKACEESSIAYVSYATMAAAVVSHFRFLRALGRAASPAYPAIP
jgi:linoleoyl-CoA desaturase